MRKKLMAGFATLGLLGGIQLLSPSDALACHKGKAHGGQIEVTLEPVQEDPIVCGKL